jgi:glutamate synthase (NADPH) small chain
MGKLRGFLEFERRGQPERDPAERVRDGREFVGTLPAGGVRDQAARCMECGVPFCQHGCPLGNLIPDWNDLVYRDDFAEANAQLHRTNNFPEFTSRLCPAPCEASCVLEIHEGDAVAIKQVERAIVDRAWDENWIAPAPAARRSGSSVAVVGSGPAGLACAQQLVRAGHAVTVYERDEAAGGLVRFGVPEFKIEKATVERRVRQLADEGVEFVFGVDVGVDVAGTDLRVMHDALVLATGARVPRDLPVPGRGLAGVHFALDYLCARTRGRSEPSAAGRHVVVVGGGDTGADCVAHAHREGAASVTQIELLGEPPPTRPDEATPWPRWPAKLRTSYALEEGGEREFSISTIAFEGDGSVEAVRWRRNAGPPRFETIAATEEVRPAGLVLLALGFSGPERALLHELEVRLDDRGTVATRGFETSSDRVFAAGDARRGQSLVVWAIAEGRRCAAAVDLRLRPTEAARERRSSGRVNSRA